MMVCVDVVVLCLISQRSDMKRIEASDESTRFL